MSDIIVKEVQTRRELREFIHLPAKVHKDEPGWLPPLYSDEWHLFDKKKNRSYSYADAAFFLAWKDRKPVGRIMTLINNRYNEIKNEKHGRFSFMECYNDREIFHALISKAEEWVRNRGMVKIVGPMGFSDKDPQGFQIEGFEYPYLFTAPTNSPYMPALLEEEGYTKEIDLVNYNLPVPESYPSVYLKAMERYSRNGEITIKVEEEEKYAVIDITEPIEKNAEIVARIVAGSLFWYVSAIGGPPTPVVVPAKPDASPATTSARSVGRNRRPVIDATTASSTDPMMRYSGCSAAVSRVPSYSRWSQDSHIVIPITAYELLSAVSILSDWKLSSTSTSSSSTGCGAATSRPAAPSASSSGSVDPAPGWSRPCPTRAPVQSRLAPAP